MATLKAGVESIHNSDDFRAYLDVQSKFHHYSFGNIMLIMAQRPEATQVAGFRKWQTMNRFVKKGEKAIKILVPMGKKVVDRETGEERQQLFFGVGNVFDVGQTDGQPLPEPVHVPVLEGEEGEELYTRTWTFLQKEGVQIEAMSEKEEERNPGLMGYLQPGNTNIIRIRNSVSQLQRAKTLLHEAAHYKGGHAECTWLPRDEAETEAESVAYIVAGHFGIDTGARSFPYVAHWAKDQKTFHSALGRIQKTAKILIEGIEWGDVSHLPAEENPS